MDLESPLAGLDDAAIARMGSGAPAIGAAAPVPAAGRAAPVPATKAAQVAKAKALAAARAAVTSARKASAARGGTSAHDAATPREGGAGRGGARATAILEAQRLHPLDDEPRTEMLPAPARHAGVAGPSPAAKPAPAAGAAAAVPKPNAAATPKPNNAMRQDSGLRPGTVINARYRVEKMIGRGGMGTVYAVRHTNTDERLALKLLHPALADNDDTIRRFRTEARAPVRIGSEHVVRVVDADVSTELGVPFMVMELLEGHDLRAELRRRGALPAGEVVLYLGQLARALDKAHSKGIVHRDLKPANLYVVQREDGSPLLKVLDFGIAKLTDDAAKELTMAGQVFGTPWYMAPEQAKGNLSRVAGSTDLWAMGLIAYKLLTGRNYWTADGMAALVAQICYEPMPPPTQSAPHLGPLFDMWFARACHRDPNSRFGSAREMVSELAQALGVNQAGAGLTTGGSNFAASAAHLPRLSADTAAPTSGANSHAPAVVAGAAGVFDLPAGTAATAEGARTNAPLYSTQPPTRKRNHVGLLVGAVVAFVVAAGALAIYFFMPPVGNDAAPAANAAPSAKLAPPSADDRPSVDEPPSAASGSVPSPDDASPDDASPDDASPDDASPDDASAATASAAAASAAPSSHTTATAGPAQVRVPPRKPPPRWRPPPKPTATATKTAPNVGDVNF